MSLEQVFFHVCDTCGRRADGGPLVDWKFETQPDRATCADCLRRDVVREYGGDYFLRGQALGISGYTDYRWMENLTVPMASAIITHCDMRTHDTVLDFGCARGYLVKALRMLGYLAWGFDTSAWAIQHCDPDVVEYVSCGTPKVLTLPLEYDWVVAKDVLEHVDNVGSIIAHLKGAARKGVFVVVPLAHGSKYDVPGYELDVTHLHRRPLQWWVGQFHQTGWSVEGRYRIKGVKDNYSGYATGNGFLTVRRVEV